MVFGAVAATATNATTTTTSTSVVRITTTTFKLIPPPRVKAPPWYKPLLALPSSWQTPIQCMMRVESRSTETQPNLGDDNGNGVNTNHGEGEQSGLFQMSNGPRGIWDIYVLPRLHVVIWKATAFQQAEGLVLVLKLDGGFHPWHGDGCIYPN